MGRENEKRRKTRARQLDQLRCELNEIPPQTEMNEMRIEKIFTSAIGNFSSETLGEKREILGGKARERKIVKILCRLSWDCKQISCGRCTLTLCERAHKLQSRKRMS